MRLRASEFARLLAVVGGVAGCAPPCDRVCRKVLACDVDSERVAFEECEAACLGQQALYETWEDTRKQQAFEDHRRCLVDATCEEIAEGVCYDPEVFVFVPR